MGALLPVEFPGAQWAVAVTGPSPANYGPNESLVRDSLFALATAVLATLAASASYIAVPAALRLALPEANPSLSLTASLGITFPFNILIGIPLYLALAEQLIAWGL